MRKIGKVSIILLAGLALAGCSQKKEKSTKGNDQLKVTKVKKRPSKMGHLSANDLSPQKTVAVITAYAGNRYAGGWNKALSKGQADGLQVSLRNQDDYSYMKDGSGVAYMVAANAGYTLKQDGNDNIYYLFSNGKEIESVSMKQMVDYLNKRNSDALVNNLAKNAKVNDDRASFDGDDSSNSSASASGKKSNIQGDKGLFNVPSGMQGTWYTYSKYHKKIITLVMNKNKISGTEFKQPLELHTIDESFVEDNSYYKMPKSYQNATKNWGMVQVPNKRINGIDFMNVRSWMQDAGDGEYYGLHTEKGQTVLVEGAGAGALIDEVYWKTPALANQYKNVKFGDLKYFELPDED
ncbi:hypothetical protein GCM10022297_13030 [Lactobacillus hamsteri]|uniref:Lipoprotein n=1 Tax=Lactobacillus hamsteri DSM 5661 = JCM 6256 TaxID=1423754 RepID=A0A0R1YE02_9LACO|nr:hypothetical protein [Lactobacillus hamsteri]KRM40578.1 hypothetical protein FC39_GL000393 [Lactobacillus hamsteri DSM 5661 = JCM 6256]